MGFFKKLFGGDEKPQQEPAPKAAAHELEEDHRYHFPDDKDDIAMMKTKVAGVNYRLKMADARKPYSGHTEFDPENPVNEKAVKLVTDEGMQIGFIPDDDLRLYYDIFDKRDGIRFHGAVGVFTNDEGKKKLFGRIMLVDIPESDDGKLFDLAQKQLDWMMERFSAECE